MESIYKMLLHFEKLYLDNVPCQNNLTKSEVLLITLYVLNGESYLSVFNADQLQASFRVLPSINMSFS
jgi:hypothetical protein